MVEEYIKSYVNTFNKVMLIFRRSGEKRRYLSTSNVGKRRMGGRGGLPRDSSNKTKERGMNQIEDLPV
jgi:hypothetical protein